MAAGRANPPWLRLLVVALFFSSCTAWVSGFITGELEGRSAAIAITLPLVAFGIMRTYGGRLER